MRLRLHRALVARPRNRPKWGIESVARRNLTRRILARLAGATLILAVVTTWAPIAVAATPEPVRLGLTPVGPSDRYFDLTMAAGQTRKLRVQVANFGSADVLSRTYAADAYSIVNGGFGAALFGNQPSGTGRWLDYETRELRLKPGGTLTIDFQVRVPDQAAPGQYLASLVAENVDPVQSGAGSVALNQVNRVAIAVAVEIPGPRHPALGIGAVSYKVAAGFSFVSFAVTNPGNVHLKPSGAFILRNVSGTEIVRTNVAMDSVYAGTDTQLEVPVTPPLAPGAYCAELHLADAATRADASTACLPFTVAAPSDVAGGTVGHGPAAAPVVRAAIDAATGQPVLLVLVIVILILVAIAILLFVRRRRQREDDGIHQEGRV
ncbi:MAG TPA: DUF916 domain-containing protein [Candidatus Limnocylindrales bacterium]|nr:DUF916 domain-containing protein [Candidatus Limnocylindrales bacterium]